MRKLKNWIRIKGRKMQWILKRYKGSWDNYEDWSDNKLDNLEIMEKLSASCAERKKSEN